MGVCGPSLVEGGTPVVVVVPYAREARHRAAPVVARSRLMAVEPVSGHALQEGRRALHVEPPPLPVIVAGEGGLVRRGTKVQEHHADVIIHRVVQDRVPSAERIDPIGSDDNGRVGPVHVEQVPLVHVGDTVSQSGELGRDRGLVGVQQGSIGIRSGGDENRIPGWDDRHRW